jgi:hypothetical protein
MRQRSWSSSVLLFIILLPISVETLVVDSIVVVLAVVRVALSAGYYGVDFW